MPNALWELTRREKYFQKLLKVQHRVRKGDWWQPGQKHINILFQPKCLFEPCGLTLNFEVVNRCFKAAERLAL